MITKPLTWDEHYRQLAIDFKGQAKLRRCVAAVHVEAAQDQQFWSTIFHYFVPHLRFHFVSHSRTWNGMQASGVTQCLSFKPYLDKDFFICIDSDYRYIMQEPDINIQNYIFQTYTYSIENHYCAAPGLDYVCEKASGQPNDIFNFDLFLKRYSEIVYELFLWHIHARSTFEFKFGRWEFYQLIGLRRNAPYPVIKNNGEAELAVLKQRVQTKLEWLKKVHPYSNIEPVRQRLTSLGVTSENVYYCLRGHNLFDSVVAVGRRVCESLLGKRKIQHYSENHRIAEIYSGGHDFEKYVKQNFSYGKYKEMVKIAEDINTFFSMGNAHPNI